MARTPKQVRTCFGVASRTKKVFLLPHHHDGASLFVCDRMVLPLLTARHGVDDEEDVKSRRSNSSHKKLLSGNF